MYIDPKKISRKEMYQHMTACILPRPIAWISTVSAEGVTNLAPFSYFSGVTSDPPTLVVTIGNKQGGRKKDTFANIEATGEFVVNIVPFLLAEAMNYTAAEFPPEVSEFDMTSVTPLPSQRVKPPGVAEAPVRLECELHQTVAVGDNPGANLVIGRILLIDVDDRVVTEEGKINPLALDAVGRLGGIGYCRTRERFELPRPKL